MSPPNPQILMINTGLTEEQVLNSFVNANLAIPTPEINDLSESTANRAQGKCA